MNQINQDIQQNQAIDLLLIKPSNISLFNYNSPNYINSILNMNCFEVLKCNNNTYGKVIKTNLISYSSQKIITYVLYEEPNYMYELQFVESNNKMKDNNNEIGTLLNINNEQIWGNVVLIKTYIDINTNNMKLTNCALTDIEKILLNRSKHIGIQLNDKFEFEEVKFEDINYIEDYFFNKPEHIEIAFLKHNLNIYYTKSKKGVVIGNIIKDTVDKCLIITKISDNIFGNITLNEINKIIKLSFVIDKWTFDDQDEYDDLNRLIIKNKYRILYKYYIKFVK
jgi:hypothetical protein